MEEHDDLTVDPRSGHVLESRIEQDCVVYAKRKGGEMLKWTSPSNAGVPDRILILPGCPVVFVEFKQRNKQLEAKQAYWKERLTALGQEVWGPMQSAWQFERAVDEWIEMWQSADVEESVGADVG